MDEIDHLMASRSSMKLGLCTGDFSFLHDMVEVLNEMEISFDIIQPGSEYLGKIDILVIDSDSEPPVFVYCDPIWARRGKDIRSTLERALFRARGGRDASLMVVGVDPGKRPGIAVLVDGILVSVYKAVSPEEIPERIRSAKESFGPRSIMVRIGDGDPGRRDRIIEELRMMRLPMELVDEKQTTTSKRLRDERAAVAIAQTKGEPL
ncbi:MAG: hypothetical protein ACMUIE_03505 [Thermoplasmatota archaeon]